MKYLFLGALVSTSAFGRTTTLVDETFTATFSDYRDISTVLTCKPGHRGGFATPDTLILKKYAVDLGIEIQGDFVAFDSTALKKEGPMLPGRPRHYDEGCKPAIEAFKKAVDRDTVEVKVHRMVHNTTNSSSRAYRNRAGEVQSVDYIDTPMIYESIQVEIAGLKFMLSQQTNHGPSKIR